MLTGHRRWRRRFLLRLEGGLPAEPSRKLDAHLARCGACRERCARIGAGHAAAVRLSDAAGRGRREALPRQADAAAAAWSLRGGAVRSRPAAIRTRLSLAFAAPRAALALAVVAAVQAALLIVLNGPALLGLGGKPKAELAGVDIRRFRFLDIADLPLNTHPHIATEGFVREVWMDAEEKTLHFKLASAAEGPAPYVVCEILNPGRLAAPREGSKVRVYGLSRYDAQTGREWQEVNPVLDIAVLKK